MTIIICCLKLQSMFYCFHEEQYQAVLCYEYAPFKNGTLADMQQQASRVPPAPSCRRLPCLALMRRCERDVGGPGYVCCWMPLARSPPALPWPA